VVNSAFVHACSQPAILYLEEYQQQDGKVGWIWTTCEYRSCGWLWCHFDSRGCLVFCSGMCDM